MFPHLTAFRYHRGRRVGSLTMRRARMQICSASMFVPVTYRVITDDHPARDQRGKEYVASLHHLVSAPSGWITAITL